MAEHYKFEMNEWRSPLCMACEEMLADALDETLSEADRAWFDRHILTCSACAERTAEAQRGAAWLEMLKSPRPEPSAHLMERILAQTSEGTQPMGVPQAIPAIQPGRVLPFRLPRFNTPRFEPRLAMTAAMAFFSIALTLNLSGVRLSQLHASDLSPSNLRRTYFQANAEVSRYYDNLRVVHVMESRVEDLRETYSEPAQQPDSTAAPQPDAQPAQQPDSQPDSQPGSQDEKPAPKGPGVSRRETPLARPRLLLTNEHLSPTKQGGLA